ncbi:hypothetical protein GR255_26525, partial [Mycobacterium tuberculosis]|nr:hypothetical protein [Mycobacterium tuberculosis]
DHPNVTAILAAHFPGQESGNSLVDLLYGDVNPSNVTDLWIPKQPDVCLVFLKTWAEEAADREHLSVDWNGDDVVESVAKSCNNTIVVTHSSGINTLPWADHPNVTAILAAHFPGQESGNSLVDLLYGDVNPS